jgi:hypothetical protein
MSVQVQHYSRRAIDFFDGMQELRAAQVRVQSVALLAIHSAVSYSDALRVGLGDDRLTAERHEEAANVLKKLCTERRLKDISGVAHLAFLLSKKSSIAYGAQRTSEEVLETIVLRAERFAIWAAEAGRQLKVEGWVL